MDWSAPWPTGLDRRQSQHDEWATPRASRQRIRCIQNTDRAASSGDAMVNRRSVPWHRPETNRQNARMLNSERVRITMNCGGDPTVTRGLDVRYTIQGHRMRVYTLDLSQEWRGIHDELIALIH